MAEKSKPSGVTNSPDNSLDLRNCILWREDRSKEDNLFARAASLVPASLKPEERHVNTVLTTEDPVVIYDWRDGRYVMETLLVSGCEFEAQTTLLRDHNQWSVVAILGSVIDVSAKSDELLGTLVFGKDLDEVCESIWRRVEQGHLRRVSVGYQYTVDDYVTLEPGETRVVKGRSFTAPKNAPLRIVFRWALRELSMVVIPADPRAQLRGTQEDPQGKSSGTSLREHSNTGTNAVDKLLEYLRSLGLPGSITSLEAALNWAAVRSNLTDAQWSHFEQLAKTESVTVVARQAVELATIVAPIRAVGVSTTTEDPSLAAQQAITDERSRVAAIRSLHREHPRVSTETANQAIDEGWDLERTQREFLASLRRATEPAPGVQIRTGVTRATLQAAMMIRAGITPDSEVLAAPAAMGLGTRRDLQVDWVVGVGRQGERRNQLEAAFETCHQRGLTNMSLMRLCQEVTEMEGERAPYNQNDMLTRAFASANFTAILGAVTHFRMLESYIRTSTAYTKFCDVMDVPDFNDNSEGMFNGVGGLKRQGKQGGQAANLNIEDPSLSKVAAERYAGMLELTDQVIIGNNFDLILRMSDGVGESAGAIPTELAWMQVLSTGNLADGRARFNNTDGNLITGGTLDSDGLSAAGTKLKAKKVAGRRIMIEGGVLACGTKLSTKAGIIIGSATRNNENNPLYRAYEILEDTAIDLGCTDVTSDPEVDIAGRPDSYWLFAKPARSIVVAFREGTNRAPVTRSKVLDGGKWGVGWDVYVDVGSAFRSRIGAVRVDL